MSYKINVFDSYIAVHGRNGIWAIDDERFRDVSVDDSVFLCTVVDEPNTFNMPLTKNVNVNVLLCDGFYKKWISKAETLRKYIKENYGKMPDFVMYADAFDVCLVSDLLMPQEMLSYYDCDVLFNGEGNFTHDGVPAPEGFDYSYYDSLYGSYYSEYVSMNEKKYGNPLQKGLNAGLFIWTKRSVYDMVDELYEYMSGDPKKGFPYGCDSDQCVLRYMQIKSYDKISIDVFNKYFLHYTQLSDADDINDCHHYKYYDTFKADYEKIINK